MNHIRNAVLFFLICMFLILSAVPGFAAEVRRVPSKASVEQGFLALTVGVDGVENLRYTGLEDKTHMYRGTFKPGGKLAFTIVATLAEQKSLPVTGRSCIMRMQVVAKKGNEVIKTQNYSKENKSNVFVNYTVPEGADTLEVSETFVLSNKSKDQKFNQKVTSRNKLILTTSDTAVAGAANSKADGRSGDTKTDKKDNTNNTGGDKNVTSKDGDKKGGADKSKTDTAGGAKESKGTSTGVLAGAAVAVIAIGAGAFFYMKKRKEDQAAAEEIARKEKLRQQAIQRQQELQQQNRQRQQEEVAQRNRMLEEERMRVEEEARQQVQREEQQRMMQEQARQQQMQRETEQQRLMQQQQDAMQQQSEAGQQPGTIGAFVAGAAGVMGSVQQNAEENEANNMPDAAPHFCQNCGTPLKPGSKFCENCGAKV